MFSIGFGAIQKLHYKNGRKRILKIFRKVKEGALLIQHIARQFLDYNFFLIQVFVIIPEH